MEKMKRFILLEIPVTTCNLRCKYCYITQQKRWKAKLPVFKYNAEQIRKALSVKRLGGVCLFNLCGGGETLLPPEMTNIIRALLEEGHYVEVVTNGTITKRFEEIIAFPPDLLKRLIFKLSFHYDELLRINKLDAFFDNAQRVRKAGCSISVELTIFDELVPEIEKIQEICQDKMGALCHLTIGRNDIDPQISILSKYPVDEYEKIWSTFSSTMLDYKLTTYYVKRKEFCYAGDWSLNIDLGSGKTRQCYKLRYTQNIFDDIDSPLQFRAIGKCCALPHCYNSHALLTLGLIPSLDAPTYAEMRNRICSDGTEWFEDDVKEFYSCKLCDSNDEYSAMRKMKTTLLERLNGIISRVRRRLARCFN